ncbi:MAG: HU family DNA-binding protein, partial [Planctomycetota bacterium]
MAKEAVTKPPTKTEILTNIAESTGLTKKQVQAVFEAMTSEIAKAVGKKGPGAFTIPGLCKVVRQNKPALPRRQVRNPATGEMVWADPKPARNV